MAVLNVTKGQRDKGTKGQRGFVPMCLCASAPFSEKYVSYTCPKCGRQKILEKQFDRKCSICNNEIRRYTITYNNEQPVQKYGVDELMRENVRYSDALGCAPSQIPEFTQRWPFMSFDKEGRCLIKNRAHKLKIMRARNYYD